MIYCLIYSNLLSNLSYYNLIHPIPTNTSSHQGIIQWKSTGSWAESFPTINMFYICPLQKSCNNAHQVETFAEIVHEIPRVKHQGNTYTYLHKFCNRCMWGGKTLLKVLFSEWKLNWTFNQPQFDFDSGSMVAFLQHF